MEEIVSQIKKNTYEQTGGSHQINGSMEKIRTMIEQITEATRKKSQHCRQTAALEDKP
jgi:methyl-accepting chemotaxis protein